MNYHNENDPRAAAWLQWLIDEGLIPNGVVDTRSIRDVEPADLRGFRQCHFFAGIGGWPLAFVLAGVPADVPLWSGSCPCQPFSAAGRREGHHDPRHLWPDFFRLIDACRPAGVVGEQVAGALGERWFHGVSADLGSAGYERRAVAVPAAAMDSPQIRLRLWWSAVDRANRVGRERWPARGARTELAPGPDPAGSDGPQARAMVGAGGDGGGPGHGAVRPGRHAAAGPDGSGDVAHRDDGGWLFAPEPQALDGGAGQGQPVPQRDDDADPRRDVARTASQRGGGGSHQPERRSEGRALAAGDDAGERPGLLGRAADQGSNGLRPTGPRDGARGGRHGDPDGEVDVGRADGEGQGRPEPAGARGEEARSRPWREPIERPDVRDLGRAERRRLEIRELTGWSGESPPWWIDATGADDGSAEWGDNRRSWWAGADWIECHDQKARRVADAGAPLLAPRFPGRVVAWRGLGNAICIPEAVEVVKALIETEPWLLTTD